MFPFKVLEFFSFQENDLNPLNEGLRDPCEALLVQKISVKFECPEDDLDVFI